MSKKLPPKTEKTTPLNRAKQIFNTIVIRQNALAPIFTIAAIVMLILIGIGIYKFALKPKPIANFLSLENTIAYAEINIDEHNPQTRSFFEMTEAHPFMRKGYFINQIEDFTQMNFEKDIKPWIKHNAGIVLIAPKNQSEEPETIIFIEYKSKSRAKNFLKKLAIKFKNDYLIDNEYKNFDVYSYNFSQDFAFIFIDNYLVAGRSKNAIHKFIDTISGDFRPISSTEEYKNFNKNYFDFSLGGAYVNLPLLAKSIVGQMQAPQIQKYFIASLESAIDASKASFIKLEAKNSYLKLTTETFFKSNFEKDGKKYSAELSQYFPSDIKIFYGGLNMAQQINNLKQSVKNILAGQIKQLFGNSVSPEKDIYPLFTEEYAFSVRNNGAVLFAMRLKDAALAEQKLKTLMIFLKKSPMMMKTKITETDLPEGGKQKDSIEVVNIVLSSEKTHRGFNIFGAQIEKEPWGIYYSVVGDVVLISSSEQALTDSIDAFIDKEKSLAASDIFDSFIKPMTKNSDEVFYLSADKYFETFSKISEYLKPVKKISAGRLYNEFSAKTVYYILIE